MRLTRMILLAVAAAGLCGCARNPVSGDRQLALMTEAQEIAKGEEVYPQYTNAYFGLFQDSDVQDLAQGIGLQVAKVTQRQNLKYEFNVVNHSEVNAFALPGGKITITRGLLTKMTTNAQLAGVLGHELAHVNARHHISSQARSTVTGLLLTVGQIYLAARGVTGAQFASAAGQLVAGLTMASYSRDQERQADALGLGYMTAAGYQPREYVEVLKILLALKDREPDRVERMFMSHPLTSERIASAESDIARNPGMQSPALAVDTTPFSLATRKLRAAAPAFIFFDQGNEFTQQGKFAWAISRFSEGIQAAPDQAIIWLGRAEAYLETNQLREAEYDIEQAKKLYPDLFYTRYFAGALQCKQRRWQASLDELQAADEIVPDYPDAQFYMGFDCENLGRQRESAQFYHDYLKQVREGEKAQYAYRRLVDWGYIQTVQ